MRTSVIIPAYNAEGFLRRAIESIRQQTIPVDEIVIGSDGSTDGTVALGRELGATVLDLPKGNVSIARNRAAQNSTGDVLFFLDADDWWTPDKVATHLEVWERAEPGVVIDHVMLTLPDGSIKETKGPVGEETWQTFLDLSSWTCGSSASILRARFDKIGGFDERLSYLEDLDFVVRASVESGVFGITDAKTHYRISEGTASRSFKDPTEQIETILNGWNFATDTEKRALRRTAYLTVARRMPLPKSLSHFRRAGWPVGHPYFYRAAAATILRTLESLRKRERP